MTQDEQADQSAPTGDDVVANWRNRVGTIRKRGRISAAVAATPIVDVRRERPRPPARLPAAGRELWQKLTASRRPGWFNGAEELLESYVTTVLQVREIEVALRKGKALTDQRIKLVRLYRQTVTSA